MRHEPFGIQPTPTTSTPTTSTPTDTSPLYTASPTPTSPDRARAAGAWGLEIALLLWIGGGLRSLTAALRFPGDRTWFLVVVVITCLCSLGALGAILVLWRSTRRDLQEARDRVQRLRAYIRDHGFAARPSDDRERAIVAAAERRWQTHSLAQTCSCGLAVHPARVSGHAIHATDCPYVSGTIHHVLARVASGLASRS